MTRGQVKKVKNWDSDSILKEIQKRYKKGQPLDPSRASYIYQAAEKYIAGGYKEALAKIGLNYGMFGIRDCSRKWNQQKIITELKRLHREGKPLNSSYTRPALRSAMRRYFGSYKDAIQAAGLDYKKIKQVWNIKDWIGSLNTEDMKKLRKRIEKLY